MKVILLRDIAGVGRRGDLKNVADGHALNFLLPRKFAIEATATAIKEREKMQVRTVHAKEETNKHSESIKTALNGKTISIKKRADEKGSLYASISAKDVVKALRDLKSAELKTIKENMIVLPRHIKTLGIHDISISIGGKSLQVNLEVIAEKNGKKSE